MNCSVNIWYATPKGLWPIDWKPYFERIKIPKWQPFLKQQQQQTMPSHIYFVCMYVCVHVPWSVNWCQRTTCRSRFSPSRVGVAGIEPRLSGLVTSAFTSSTFNFDPDKWQTRSCDEEREAGQAVVTHTFKPSTWESEAGGSLWVWGQPGLQYEFQDCQGYTLYGKRK